MSEVYGQANRYGEGIRDMSDFKSGIDDDLGMGENESTPAAAMPVPNVGSRREMNPATASRLNALKNIGPGWNSYGAYPISHEAIERARKLLSAMTVDPLIFPTVDGGIELSWCDDSITMTIHDDSCELYVEEMEE